MQTILVWLIWCSDTKTLNDQTNQPQCSVTGPGLSPLIGYYSAVSGLNLGVVLVCQQNDFGFSSLLSRCSHKLIVKVYELVLTKQGTLSQESISKLSRTNKVYHYIQFIRLGSTLITFYLSRGENTPLESKLEIKLITLVSKLVNLKRKECK